MPALDTSTFKNQFPPEVLQGGRFLLAVSGGLDSMVLLHLFIMSRYPIEVAHVNYNLRGNDSVLDQKLVENFCEKNNIKFHLKTVHRDEKKGSVQLWARNIRYDFFSQVLKSERLNFIVTAHHLNDQLETFLLNLSRGTGLNGLTGIPKLENNVFRPLLTFSKEDIRIFAEEHDIMYRDDSSNAEDYYLRNKIRHKIVPELLSLNTNSLQNFQKTINYLHETKEFVEFQIQEVYKDLAEEENGETRLKRESLSFLSEFEKFEILKRWGFDNSKEINKIFLAEKNKTFQNKNYRLTIDRDFFIIAPQNHPLEQVETFYFEKESRTILDLTQMDFGLENDTMMTWYFNTSQLNFPLILRSPKTGDIFRPVHFSGSKKVSKFLKDEKLPILAKQKTRVLTDANHTILGVLPLRQDRRYAADYDSDQVIKVIFKK